MSKRKRQIKKKKQLEEQQEQELQAAETAEEHPVAEVSIEPSEEFEHASQGAEGPVEEAELAGEVVEADREEDSEPELDDDMIVEPAARPRPARPASKGPPAAPSRQTVQVQATWLGKNKENLLLGMLVLYVLLLGLGTVGELFEIEWILNLPLFK